MDFNFDKVIQSPWVAGFAGAVVALRGAPGTTWLSRLFHVSCGLAIAGFLTGGLAEFFGVQTVGMQSGLAFMLGLFGMNLADAVTTAIRETKIVDILPWRRKKGDD